MKFGAAEVVLSTLADGKGAGVSAGMSIGAQM